MNSLFEKSTRKCSKMLHRNKEVYCDGGEWPCVAGKRYNGRDQSNSDTKLKLLLSCPKEKKNQLKILS